MDKPKIPIKSEEKDGTTDRVIAWIKFLGGEFLRLITTSKISFRKLLLSKIDDIVEHSIPLGYVFLKN